MPPTLSRQGTPAFTWSPWRRSPALLRPEPRRLGAIHDAVHGGAVGTGPSGGRLGWKRDRALPDPASAAGRPVFVEAGNRLVPRHPGDVPVG